MTRYNFDLSKPDKFREAIIYISRKSELDPKFSVTKLNKILFFSDFVFFGQHGKSITGQKYSKLERGPVPKAMMPVSKEMEADGDLIIREGTYYGYPQKKPIALRDPHLEVFLAIEIAMIDSVIEQFWRFTAKEISGASHGFIGWQIADFKETIPYGLAWIDEDPEFSDAEIEAILKVKPLSDQEKQRLKYH